MSISQFTNIPEEKSKIQVLGNPEEKGWLIQDDVRIHKSSLSVEDLPDYTIWVEEVDAM